MRCTDCTYCWQEDGENYPSCKYPYNDGYAPCEYEEPEEINWEDYM